METLFDTRGIAQNRRFKAWKDALCGNYVTVDAWVDDPETYFGYIRYADLGGIQLSETHGPKQVVRRRNQHLTRLEKDCFYLQIMPRGTIGVRQRGTEILTHVGKMGFYYASEPYELDCINVTKGRFLEIPREALQACAGDTELPLVRGIDSTHGIGKVLQDLCGTLAEQTENLTDAQKSKLGLELVGLTALALTSSETPVREDVQSLKSARLSGIKRFIRDNAVNSNLNAARIARENGISARYLHKLFEAADTTAMDYLWQCRLELGWSLLTEGRSDLTITQIAFAVGFSSSSHFSQQFRQYFGVTPTVALDQKGCRKTTT